MKLYLLKYGTLILASVISFILPIKGLLITTGALLFADFFSGIYAAHKRGEKISSRRMADSVSKTILYLGAVILSRLFHNHIVPDIPVEKITASVVCTVEFKSVLENIRSITGIDVFSALKSKLNERTEQ